MNVLSVCDGISVAQLALKMAGISVNKYYASEIDKYAIAVTKHNFPNTKYLGDMENWRQWDIDWSSIDFLVGGTPCQGFSFAGAQLAFDDPRSKLFFVYADILEHIKNHNPNVKFLLENVKMKKEYLSVITKTLGVDPEPINSALLSAQNRQRYYWANFPISQPADIGICLADVIENSEIDKSKAHCVDPDYYKDSMQTFPNKSGNQLVFAKKSLALLSTMYKENAKSMIKRNKKGWLVADNDLTAYRKLSPLECERLQTLPDCYTLVKDADGKQLVSDTQRYKGIGNAFNAKTLVHICKEGLL